MKTYLAYVFVVIIFLAGTGYALDHTNLCERQPIDLTDYPVLAGGCEISDDYYLSCEYGFKERIVNTLIDKVKFFVINDYHTIQRVNSSQDQEEYHSSILDAISEIKNITGSFFQEIISYTLETEIATHFINSSMVPLSYSSGDMYIGFFAMDLKWLLCGFEDCSNIAKMKKHLDGCPESYCPVCSQNNLTYQNKCYAKKRGQKIQYVGPCNSGKEIADDK